MLQLKGLPTSQRQHESREQSICIGTTNARLHTGMPYSLTDPFTVWDVSLTAADAGGSYQRSHHRVKTTLYIVPRRFIS